MLGYQVSNDKIYLWPMREQELIMMSALQQTNTCETKLDGINAIFSW